MSEFWAQAAALVWGPVTVVLLVGTGIYLSFRLKFTHLRQFGLGWRSAAQGNEVPARTHGETSPPPGDISPWQGSTSNPSCVAILGTGIISEKRNRQTSEEALDLPARSPACQSLVRRAGASAKAGHNLLK